MTQPVRAAAPSPPTSAEYEQLCRARLAHLVPVREPLVLVSQVFRSGGTLLSQLFDGHPECHAHPHELRIGHPGSRDWPRLDLSAPDDWFDLLYEKYPGKHLKRGYAKVGGGFDAIGEDADVFPFLFLPQLQRRIFDACVRAGDGWTGRKALDCYFTSYFNAWLDNQNLYAGPKKCVTAFAPGLSVRKDSVAGFFADYPDGVLISLVREPRAWYASAQRQRKKTVEAAMKKWRRSANAALRYAAGYGDRVVVLTYEQLVHETEATMRRIAERMGISMSPGLLVPTFNGRPIRANSADPVTQYGVLTDRTQAYRGSLDGETILRIDEEAGDLYGRVLEVARARP